MGHVSIILIIISVSLVTIPVYAVSTIVNVEGYGKFDLKYEIEGGSLEEIFLDDFNTITVTVQSSRDGFLTITLPRDLIDSKFYGDDNFFILIDGEEEDYDETTTELDRTLTIPIRAGDKVIDILGTCSVKHPCPEVDAEFPTPESPEIIEKRIDDTVATILKQRNLKGVAKLLIFSNAAWSGTLTDSGLDSVSMDGKLDKIIDFECYSSVDQVGTFRVSFHKTFPPDQFVKTLEDIILEDRVHDGYLYLIIIQDGMILDQAITSASYGLVTLVGQCAVAASEETIETALDGGGCLIATATYGSELAPQIQQLRELRDNYLLKTESGTSFMSGFNQFYYSFSPTIADLERQSPVFKEVVKLTITPLVTSLSILNYVDMNSEAKVLGYGIGLILLNVGMYIVAPVVIGIVFARKV